jgi:mono/diheme cytochrome c family protein
MATAMIDLNYSVPMSRAVLPILLPVLAIPMIAGAAETSSGPYSVAQATRGAKSYGEHCASCHGAGLQGVDVTPPLVGPRFIANWSDQSIGALVQRIHTTMPQDDPGALGMGATRDVVAYILENNAYPTGAADLPTDAAALDAIKLGTPKP